MSDALEATAPRRRIRHVRSVHTEHAPAPVTVLDPEHLEPAIAAIRARVIRLKRSGAGSYLFIDDTMQAFVISELQSIATTWVREHFGWLVAFYAPRRRDGALVNPDGTPYLTATVGGVTEDVREHLIDLRTARA